MASVPSASAAAGVTPAAGVSATFLAGIVLLALVLGSGTAFLLGGVLEVRPAGHYFGISLLSMAVTFLILWPSLLRLIRRREQVIWAESERRQVQNWAVEADHLLEERVRNIVAHAPFGYFAFNLSPEGQVGFSYVSPVFERMSGLAADAVRQDWRHCLSAVHPHDREMLEHSITQAVTDLQPWQQEFRIVASGDAVHWYAGRSVPHRRADGHMVWHGFIHDITALRKNQESQFKEAVRRRILFEQSGDGIVLLDHKGRVEECNSRFCELLGYEPDEVQSLHVWDWDADRDRAALLADLAERPDAVFETRWRRRDGRMLPMEIASNAVTLDDQRWILCICRDVSQRKAAERALQQSEEKYGRIFANAPVGIVQFNTAGRLVDCNESFMHILGSTRQELIGLDVFDLPNAAVVAAIQGCLAGEVRRYEDVYHSVTGNRDAYVRAVFSPLRDGEDQIVGGVGVVEDITERLAARAELERQANFTQAVIDAEADGVAVCHAVPGSPGLRFTIWNPALVRITGYTQEEINQMGWFKTLFDCPTARSQAAAKEARVARGENLLWEEWRIRHKDGHQRIIQVHASSVHWERGQIHILSVIREVTEQRLAQQQLAERQELLDAIIENLPVMLFVKTADDLRYVHFNRAGETMTGMHRSELMGRTDFEIFPEEQAQRFNDDDRQVLRCVHGVDIPEEVFLTSEHGRRVLHTRKVPIRAADGQVSFLLGISEDITERQALENTLKQRELYLRAVLDNFPFLVWLKDRESRFLAVNRPFALACGQGQPENLIGLTDLDIWPADLANLYRQDDWAVLESGQRKNVEEPVEVTGHRTWIETYKSPVMLDGKVIGTVGFARDITDKKQITAELEQYRQELERRVDERTAELAHAVKDAEAFSYSVSHDLRSPLRAIAGYSRILMDHEKGRLSEEGQRMLDRIERNGLRMAELIDDILDYSRAGRQKLQTSRVNLTALAQRVIDEFSETYPEAEVVLDPLPEVEADANMLRQVLVNLIGNGLKFSAKGRSRLVVGSVLVEGETRCYVRDNGVGFDMRYAGNLFNMFQRLHSEAEFPGTGVGLAIVRRLLERHSGRIWVESAPDQGATFWFTLGAAK